MAEQKALDSFFPGGLPNLPAIANNATRTQVFTHHSLHRRPIARFEDPAEDPSPDNELLDHLGDAVLYLCVTDILRALYPNIRPRVATSMRTKLLGSENLAAIASQYHLGAHLRMHEAQSSLRESNLILASTFRAYVGALYASEFSLVKPWLDGLFTPYAHEAYKISLSQYKMGSPYKQETLPPATSVPPPAATSPPNNDQDTHNTRSLGHKSRRNKSRGRAPLIPEPKTVAPKEAADVAPNSQFKSRQNQPSRRGGRRASRSRHRGNVAANNTQNSAPPADSHSTPDPLRSFRSPPPSYRPPEPILNKPFSQLPPLPMIKDDVTLRLVFADWLLGNGVDPIENLQEKGDFILKMCLHDILHKLSPKLSLDAEMSLRSTLLSHAALAKIAKEYEFFRNLPASILDQIKSFLPASTDNLAKKFTAYVGGLSKDQPFDSVVNPWLHHLFTPRVQKAYTEYKSTSHTRPSASTSAPASSHQPPPRTGRAPPPSNPKPPSRPHGNTAPAPPRPATATPLDYGTILTQYATEKGVTIVWRHKRITSAAGANWEARVFLNNKCIGEGVAPRLETAANSAARFAYEDLEKRFGRSER